MLSSSRTILHVDMDAFFASVEQRDNPALRGKPVIVAGRPEQRGVVSAASYEARSFGVHSAMPTRTALRLCPEGIFLPVRMQLYAREAHRIRAILAEFSAFVEPLSLDEAFLDVTGTVDRFGSSVELARQIKTRLLTETGLIASVGIACNKYLAKLASDLGKPDGLFVISPERLRAILDPLPVSRLWGVGTRGQARLHALGVRTIGQLASSPEHLLVTHFGESGRHLWRLAQGCDDREVVAEEQAKSLSTETTFPEDIPDRETLRSWLVDLVDHLGVRLRAQGKLARTIELKARSGDFRTHTRSHTLDEPTDLSAVLLRTARELLDRLPNHYLPLRLLGVAVSGLLPAGEIQGHLFEQQWREKQRSLDRTMDRIRQQFGQDAIGRAAGRRPGEA